MQVLTGSTEWGERFRGGTDVALGLGVRVQALLLWFWDLETLVQGSDRQGLIV